MKIQNNSSHDFCQTLIFQLGLQTSTTKCFINQLIDTFNGDFVSRAPIREPASQMEENIENEVTLINNEVIYQNVEVMSRMCSQYQYIPEMSQMKTKRVHNDYTCLLYTSRCV